MSLARVALGAAGPTDGPVRGKNVEQDHLQPSATNAVSRVCAGQPSDAVNDRQYELSVPRFPWHY